MNEVQYIEIKGRRRFAVVPIDLWEKLATQGTLEDVADVAALAKFRRQDSGTRIPSTVVKRILSGSHPIAAWRAERGLSAAELARRAGVSRQMVSLLESGKRTGTATVLRSVATELGVPVDALLQHVEAV